VTETPKVLHDCGCLAHRSVAGLGQKATCPTHGRCEVVGVRMLRDALARGLPAPWLEDGPRPSDTKPPAPDWDPERWETKD
jgi:hypothetical protein